METNVKEIAAHLVEIIEGSGESANEIMTEMQRLIDHINTWRISTGHKEI